MPTSAARSSGGPILARGAAVRSRPPSSAVLVMAGGRRASASRAPAWRRPLLHPAGHLQRRVTCPGATSLAAPSAAKSREAPRAWSQSHTGPACTARTSSASRRASSSRQVATPFRAWSPRCVSRKQGSLPRRAALALAKLSSVDPHDE